MSQYADLTKVFRTAAFKGDIDKDVAVELFVEVLDAIEWGHALTDDEDDSPGWEERDRLAAHEVLFGNE